MLLVHLVCDSLLSSNIVLFLLFVVEIFHRPIIVFTINLMRK